MNEVNETNETNEKNNVLDNIHTLNECMRHQPINRINLEFNNDLQVSNIFSLMCLYLLMYFGLSNLILVYFGYQLLKTPSKRLYYVFSGFLFYYLYGFLSTLYMLTCLSSYYMLNNIMVINYYNSHIVPKKNILVNNFNKNFNNRIKVGLFSRLLNKYNFIVDKFNYFTNNYYISQLVNNLDKTIGYMFLYVKNGVIRLCRDLSFSFINLFNRFDVSDLNVVNSQKKKSDTFFIDEFDNLDDLLMNDDEINNFRDNNMNQQMDMLLNMMGKAQNLMSQVSDLKTLDKNNLRKRNINNNISI